ncbi:ABC transporter substrate-binding protein [Piscinibacter terrae]|uniref:Probable sugar-binding periplasmic protein n=1 Tax=Piscinibacter terrae TaxID=2496871 RepID=A0A3N7HIY0_9BURK|nr:ABC transporter substrate-binding protein [Albitalea terrae]RQP21994.1 carbohydrate ABC transporter substrate-binding protein [Albitalea terrae]
MSSSLTRRLIKASAIAAACLINVPAFAGQVEVLHWWTSGGESKSVEELKRLLAAQGHTWRDFAVAGGGGDTAMAVLRQRVLAGNPPAAAQIKGPAIQEWGKLNVLADLDDVATEQKWDAQLPKVVANVMKVNGHYVAAPVNVHRVNWLWINREALRKTGSKVPNTWDEFFSVAEKMKANGIIPVAHGGQSWQEFTTFESVVLGVAGAEFYRRAFVQLDPTALKSNTMASALQTFRRIKDYTDAKAPGRDWNVATGMVIKGEAGMQFMGDWAKGEFLAAGKQPAKDFVCVAAPGTARAFTFNVDSFAMFRLKDPSAVKAQKALAATIMRSDFQQTFNLNKGSIPVGTGVQMDKFDLCAQESAAYFAATAMINTLVPSIAHLMAQPAPIETALREVVAAYWNNDRMTTEEAMIKMVSGVAKAKQPVAAGNAAKAS